MNVDKILNHLRQEHEQVTEVIATLERLALGRGKRRGRPPKWMTEGRDQRKRGEGRPRKRPAEDTTP